MRWTPRGVREPSSAGGDREAGRPHNTPGTFGNRAGHELDVHTSPTGEIHGVVGTTRGMAGSAKSTSSWASFNTPARFDLGHTLASALSAPQCSFPI